VNPEKAAQPLFVRTALSRDTRLLGVHQEKASKFPCNAHVCRYR
jgi:hypothetical protein